MKCQYIIRKCRKCVRLRHYHAKGLCDSCYNMRWRLVHRTACGACGAKVHWHGKYKLCRSCACMGNRNAIKNRMFRFGHRIITYSISAVRRLG